MTKDLGKYPLGDTATLTITSPVRSSLATTVSAYLVDVDTGTETAVGSTAGKAAGQTLNILMDFSTAGLKRKRYRVVSKNGSGMHLLPNQRYDAAIIELI